MVRQSIYKRHGDAFVLQLVGNRKQYHILIVDFHSHNSTFGTQPQRVMVKRLHNGQYKVTGERKATTHTLSLHLQVLK